MTTLPEAADEVDVEAMTANDAEAVLAIYQQGLDTGQASFETAAPDWTTWDQGHLPAHRFVAVDAARTVVGWVAAVPVSDRCAYTGVVEHSVYVSAGARGRGIGRVLLEALITSTEQAGIWTVQTGIFPENLASLALHEGVGFRIVGLRERIGQHRGQWRDALLLERRSRTVN